VELFLYCQHKPNMKSESFRVTELRSTWSVKPLHHISTISLFFHLLLSSVSVIVVKPTFNLSVYFHFILFAFYQQTEAAKFLQYLMGRSGVSNRECKLFWLHFMFRILVETKKKNRMIIWYTSANQVCHLKKNKSFKLPFIL
jgi:hypothetical protein